MKLSARNILKGMVVQIKADEVNSEVILELPGGAPPSSVAVSQIMIGLPGARFFRLV